MTLSLLTTRRFAALVCSLLLAAGALLAPTASATRMAPTVGAAPAAPGAPDVDRAARRSGVVVDGAVEQPGEVTRRVLRSFEQQTVETSYTAMGTPVTRTFKGPLLVDVLRSRGPLFDSSVSNDFLRFAVRALASDDYQAVVAWGEIDPGFEGKQVLVALKEDGVRLQRPRLVVPGDARGGRYVTDVETLTVLDLGA